MITDNDLQQLSKEELITLIIKERKYNKLLLTAFRHYANRKTNDNSAQDI